jgi:hypothetical protein
MQISAFSNQLTQAIAEMSKPLLYKLLEMAKVANSYDAAKIDKVITAIPDHLASFTAAGAIKDSGKLVPTGDVVGTSDIQTLSNKTITDSALTEPSIASFINAQHDHSSAATGGLLTVAALDLAGIICHDDQVICNNNEVVTL